MTSDDEIRSLRTELVLTEARRLKDYDDAHPNVGMGYFRDYFINQALKNKNIRREDCDQLKLTLWKASR